MQRVFIGLENQILEKIVKDVCLTHSLEVKHFADIKSGNNEDLVFVDSKYLLKLTKSFENVVLLTDQPFEQSFLDSVKHTKISLIQAMDSHNFQWEIDKLVRQLREHRLLDLRDYLQPNEAFAFKQIKMTNFRDVYQYLDDAKSFLALEEFRNLGEKLTTVAHEVIMNAFFDSQKSFDGKQVHYNIERSDELEIAEHKAPVLTIGQDNSFVGFSVRDNFGTLRFTDIKSSLDKCLQQDDVLTIRASGEGAGIGLFMCCSTSSKIVFNVCPGQYTEVICLLFKTKRNVEDESIVPSFSFFERAS